MILFNWLPFPSSQLLAQLDDLTVDLIKRKSNCARNWDTNKFLAEFKLIILTWLSVLPWRIQWQFKSTSFIDSIKPGLSYLSYVFPGALLGWPWYFKIPWLLMTYCSVHRTLHPLRLIQKASSSRRCHWLVNMWRRVHAVHNLNRLQYLIAPFKPQGTSHKR